jgi:hypothetical protein
MQSLILFIIGISFLFGNLCFNETVDAKNNLTVNNSEFYDELSLDYARDFYKDFNYYDKNKMDLDVKAKALENYRKSKLILLAAATCAGSYASESENSEFNYLSDYGWKIYPLEAKEGKVKVKFTVAESKKDAKGNKLLVLAFRGSTTLKDWVYDLAASRVVFGGTNLDEFDNYTAMNARGEDKPKVHNGYNSYARAALRLTIDFENNGKTERIVDILKKNKNVKMILTGHSLGGAVATIFAERLISMGVSKEQIPVITFGAPAVGNKQFVKEYKDKINLIRVVTAKDPVPGAFQTFFSGYQQFGEKIKFDVSTLEFDFQHPIAIYVDFAYNNLEKAKDKAIATGAIAPRKYVKLDGTGPLIAVWINKVGDFEPRESTPEPNQIFYSELQHSLERYVFVNLDIDPNNDQKYDYLKMYNQAKAMGADYILYNEVGVFRFNHSDNYSMGVCQIVFNKKGFGDDFFISRTRITNDKLYLQSAIELLRRSKRNLSEKYPWLEYKPLIEKIRVDKEASWTKNGISNNIIGSTY